MAVALEIEVRPLRPEDTPRVADLLVVAFAEEFAGTGAEPGVLHRQLRTGGWVQREPLRRLTAWLGVEFAFFVAAHREQIVGCAGVMGQHLPVIHSVAVHPRFRRLGIAEALVREAERFAADHGHDRVVLDVLLHNLPALTLYHKLGYEEYHRYRCYTRALTGTALAVVMPPGYTCGPARPNMAGAAARIEQEALPERFRAVVPSLAPRYTGGVPTLMQRLFSGVYSYRRALRYQGQPVGFLLAHLVSGQREARIEYPIVAQEHNAALASAVTELIAFLRKRGAGTARLDLSEDRPDQHAIAEELGFSHRWTFVQMLRRLTREWRIPVRSTG